MGNNFLPVSVPRTENRSWTLNWPTLYQRVYLSLTVSITSPYIKLWSVIFCCNFNLYWADLVAVWLTPPTWHFVVWPVFWLWQCRAVMVRWYIVWLVNDNSYCCPIAVDSLLKVLLELVTTLIHSSFTWAFAFFTALSITLGTFHWSPIEWMFYKFLYLCRRDCKLSWRP